MVYPVFFSFERKQENDGQRANKPPTIPAVIHRPRLPELQDPQIRGGFDFRRSFSEHGASRQYRSVISVDTWKVLSTSGMVAGFSMVFL
jgi:hypothetical protein